MYFRAMSMDNLQFQGVRCNVDRRTTPFDYVDLAAGDKVLSSDTELFDNREQCLRAPLQLVKIGPLYNCMGALTTGAKNNSWYSSSGQEGRIHPGGSASNCRFTTQHGSCLAAHNLDYQFIFWHFKRLTHKSCSH